MRKPAISDPDLTVYVGDCVEVMAEMDEASIDAIVCDPPYELEFMGRAWDRSGVAFDPATWRAALRVLKPGGHLLAFGGTRTFHRLTCAIEDAGFEVRDCLSWLYGSGFPKSLDVSKAIDKTAGLLHHEGGDMVRRGSHTMSMYPSIDPRDYVKPEPKSEWAHRWQGWGTALKPAWEPIVVARKPLAGTVAANVLEHGTGAINVDGCRVEGGVRGSRAGGITNTGRWPANVVLDEVAAERLDGEVGELPGPSRFFYTAKVSRSERGEGNTHPTVKPVALMRWLVRLVTPPSGLVLDPFAGSGSTLVAARAEGFRSIGIERDGDDYLPIIAERTRELSLLGGLE